MNAVGAGHAYLISPIPTKVPSGLTEEQHLKTHHSGVGLMTRSSIAHNWLCGQAVRHSLRAREVRGLIHGRVKLRTLKLVLAAAPPSVRHYGFSVKSGPPGVKIM
ncbi:hypothetical protein ElyMa_000937900 [Elysia marginata]|uniref:Uncharacterized protein n=1 Tax=Elysia marginata TaxID=1093978 RepID=A0AAV4HCM5_9GAST|nr:hypothetical protein ElyMa_000937900 [Elysia marginata]